MTVMSKVCLFLLIGFFTNDIEFSDYNFTTMAPTHAASFLFQKDMMANMQKVEKLLDKNKMLERKLVQKNQQKTER